MTSVKPRKAKWNYVPFNTSACITHCRHQTHERKLWKLDSEQSCTTQLKGWVLRGFRQIWVPSIHPGNPNIFLSFFPGCPHIHLFSTSSFPPLSPLFISNTVSTNSTFGLGSRQSRSIIATTWDALSSVSHTRPCGWPVQRQICPNLLWRCKMYM